MIVGQVLVISCLYPAIEIYLLPVRLRTHPRNHKKTSERFHEITERRQRSEGKYNTSQTELIWRANGVQPLESIIPAKRQTRSGTSLMALPYPKHTLHSSSCLEVSAD